MHDVLERPGMIKSVCWAVLTLDGARLDFDRTEECVESTPGVR